MARILGIESTCDETAAAIVVDGYDVRSNVVASQADIHARYRGVVPEIASRAHIENILPVIVEALEEEGATKQRSDEATEGEGGSGFGVQGSVGKDDEARSPKPASMTNDEAQSRYAGPHSPDGPMTQSRDPQSPDQKSKIKNQKSKIAIDAIAVAHRPGLIGSLLIGVTAAKTLAWAWDRPLIAVDHVHAHLYSVMLERPDLKLPHAVGLVISGGHTALYDVPDFEHVRLIGSTIDDAVGEAYDKVASILGLGYPGGPIIDELAQDGDPAAIKFPRTLLGRDSLDFSFSGLKTAVLYHVRGFQGRQRSAADLSRRQITDVAASFQAACIDVLVRKLQRAVKRTGAKAVIIGGGVSANRGLRQALARFGVPVHFPPLRYCTDNAAMIAGLAELAYRRGDFGPLSLDAVTYSQFREHL